MSDEYGNFQFRSHSSHTFYLYSHSVKSTLLSLLYRQGNWSSQSSGDFLKVIQIELQMRIIYSILLLEQQKRLVSTGQWYVKGVVSTALHVLSHLIHIIFLIFQMKLFCLTQLKQLVEDHTVN